MKSFLAAWLFSCLLVAAAQTPPAPQNPSPTTESVRRHERVPQAEVKGKRWTLSVGTLLLPESARVRDVMPLFIHFHGAPWLAEWSVARRNRRAAVVTVNLGPGSGVYARAFADPTRFVQLLQEAAQTLSPSRPVEFRPVVLSGFSAGYGAIREILRQRANWDHIDATVLADGLHAGYLPDGQPGPINAADLQPFLDFAREAVAGHKQMVFTHSEIFPGTFASTTETANFLLEALHITARPVLRWGPLGMQQISEARQGKLHILGFAGNTAPDHIDHFYALQNWLKLVR